MDGHNGKSLNLVHQDEIWKDHINRELLAQKYWPNKWGFLSDIYEELQTKPTDSSNKNMEPEKSAETNNKKKFPATDSKMIGWKSALSNQNAYGIPEGRARGKSDILRKFKWPKEYD